MYNFIFQDFPKNQNNIKGKFILFFFRLTNYLCYSENRLIKILSIPLLIFYKIFIEWILTVELPAKTKVGKGVSIFHGQGLTVNDNTIIGENVILRNGTVLGNLFLKNGKISGSPIIGNNVEFGANCCVIGEIKIGNNVKVGAGAVVVKDVPDNCVVVGNPAKIINSESE
jgi:putative colanic acid biosynthesis acetyltransferase WcaB